MTDKRQDPHAGGSDDGDPSTQTKSGKAPGGRSEKRSRSTQMMERRVLAQAVVIALLLGGLYFCSPTPQ